MLETLLVLGLVVAIPLALVALLAKLLIGLVLLPFRLLGGVLKGLAGLIGGIAALLGVLLVLVMLPLLPLFLVAAGVWMLVRPRRPTVLVQRVA
jgi:hypothetical protein